jgi:1,4-alpha-glucan branching enzyme
MGANGGTTDPYSFGPVLGPVDDLLMAQGTHVRLYDKMGAHVIDRMKGAQGVHFAVWAPNRPARLRGGDFNDWDGRRHQMRHRRDVGRMGDLHSRHWRRRATSSRSSARKDRPCR